MAKHKLSRRKRREQGVPKPPPRPVADQMRPIGSLPVNTPSVSTSPASNAPTSSSVTATFSTTDANRDASGIVTELAALEYPAIRRDLKKLGVTILAFALLLVALAAIDAQTHVIEHFGQHVYKFTK